MKIKLVFFSGLFCAFLFGASFSDTIGLNTETDQCFKDACESCTSPPGLKWYKEHRACRTPSGDYPACEFPQHCVLKCMKAECEKCQTPTGLEWDEQAGECRTPQGEYPACDFPEHCFPT